TPNVTIPLLPNFGGVTSGCGEVVIDVVGIEVVVWRCGSGCDGVAAMAWWCAGCGGGESGRNLAGNMGGARKYLEREEKYVLVARVMIK
ncbi:hypothetical protein Tco_1496742, partial [Tanacetum coccineum]